MNEPPASDIRVFRPFDEGFKMMKRILFQPFDLSKWLVIGFAAWLATIGSGGFNFQYRSGQDWARNPQFQQFTDWIHQIPMPILVSAVACVVLFIVALALLFAWLRARGRFIFTDCVVRNRAAIAQPWREFRLQGNSFFLFSLVVGCCFLVVAVLFALPFLLPMVRRTFVHLQNIYLFSVIALWVVVLLMLLVIWGVLAHVMVIIMYRRRCRALEAFGAAISFVSHSPGEMTLYCLFWILLAVGVILASCVLVCATCCLAALPYIGAVILLPIHVWLRSFALLFFRQFGPDYDVWAGIETPPQATSEVVPPPPQIPPPAPAI